jgi:hypothetical protein
MSSVFLCFWVERHLTSRSVSSTFTGGFDDLMLLMVDKPYFTPSKPSTIHSFWKKITKHIVTYVQITWFHMYMSSFVCRCAIVYFSGLRNSI